MNTSNPYAPPRAAVSDIIDESDELEPAGRGIRLGAALLDGLILSVLVILPLVVGVMMSYYSNRGAGIAWLFFIVGTVVYAWFNILYVVRNGQSIAKKWLGIKVVRSDGSPASLGRIFWLRNVVNQVLANLVPFYGFVDPLLIFSDSRQCVHDKIADTIVVVA
jgi:uncharacterized RDD family membrane protein YckC